MKLATWIIVLSVLNFGIGWVSASLADHGDVEPQSEPRRDGNKNGWGRHRAPSVTPFIDEVRDLSPELELSAEQEAAFDARVAEISAKAKEHERAIFALVHDSRDLIPEILTTEQLQKLEELRQERWREFHRQSLERTREWFITEGGVQQGETLDQVMAVFERADERRSEFFRESKAGSRSSADEDCSKDPTEWRQRYEELKKQKYSELEAAVGVELSERYRERYSSDRRGRGEGRSDGSRGGRHGPGGMERRFDGRPEGASPESPRGGGRRGGPPLFGGARR